MLVKTGMDASRKDIEAHKEHWEGGEASINESNFASIGIISTSLGKIPVSHLRHSRSKVLSMKHHRRDRKTQIFEGKRAQGAV